MKKVLSVLFAIAIFFTFSIIPHAEEITITDIGNPLIYIDDQAELLTDTEELDIISRIEHIKSQYGIDAVIHTTMSTYGVDVGDYAENYYISNGYAEDGLIFVINLNNNEVGNRDFYTYCQGSVYHTFGFEAYASDYGYINDEVLPYLANEDYYSAFVQYLTLTEGYLAGEISYQDTEQWLNEVEDYYYEYEDDYYSYDYSYDTSPVVKEIIVVVIGVVIAFFITRVMKNKMNTAVVKREAADYVKSGSFNITKSMDIFTHRTVTKTPIPKNTPKSSGGGVSGGGGGGGFSRSSNSGGGGGKF